MCQEGLTSVEDSIDPLIQRPEDDIKNSKERLIMVTRNNISKHKDKQNNNNLKPKMGRKPIVWIFQVINKRNLSREELDMTKKRKP